MDYKISIGKAKQILNRRDEPDVKWLINYIENLCRSNSYPLQMVSNDFLVFVGMLFEPKKALETIDTLRDEYNKVHPFVVQKPDMEFMNSIPCDSL
jgi:hypothetical protein